jgi:LysR family transcriptional regulator, glycine cleavage system transcriptional activator
MRNLSMLRAIQAFEAAARHQNYADAASELSVTPAAVGQQVRALEAWLGVTLFRRLGSGSHRLLLTDEALAALPDFSEGLDRLDSGLRRLRQQRQRAVVTVSASQAFVARWLLPRLDRFTAAHPHIDVRLDVSDRLVDVKHGEADLAIRCGAGRWAGLKAVKLMDEEVFPVCSPALLGGQAAPRTAKQVTGLGLIHDLTMASAQAFPNWSQWLQAQGLTLAASPRGLHINASAAAIQAALNGQGVALARRVFVQDDITHGRLLRLLPQVSWPVAWAYYCVHTEDSLQRSAVTVFMNWLTDEAKASALKTASPSA